VGPALWVRQHYLPVSRLVALTTARRDYFRFLVDPNTLGISNKWRRDRGLPELRMVDIAPDPQAST